MKTSCLINITLPGLPLRFARPTIARSKGRSTNRGWAKSFSRRVVNTVTISSSFGANKLNALEILSGNLLFVAKWNRLETDNGSRGSKLSESSSFCVLDWALRKVSSHALIRTCEKSRVCCRHSSSSGGGSASLRPLCKSSITLSSSRSSRMAASSARVSNACFASSESMPAPVATVSLNSLNRAWWTMGKATSSAKRHR